MGSHGSRKHYDCQVCLDILSFKRRQVIFHLLIRKGNEVANDNAKNGNRLCTKTEVNAISTGQTDMKFKVFLNGKHF